MTAPAYIRGRLRDKDADARDAARACIDRVTHRRAACRQYHIGWDRLREAIDRLLEERARRNTP